MATPRLLLRGWQLEDASAAVGIYGHPEVAARLSPAIDRVSDVAGMRMLLQEWIDQDARSVPPAGRWAIHHRDDDRLIGGVYLLPLPPGEDDLAIGWQLHPQVWGRGYATETTHAVARWAFTHNVEEVFAVVRPENVRAAATVRRNGMEWVGETDKYFGVSLHVYRLRPADLDRSVDQNGCPAPPPRTRPDLPVPYTGMNEKPDPGAERPWGRPVAAKVRSGAGEDQTAFSDDDR